MKTKTTPVIGDLVRITFYDTQGGHECYGLIIENDFYRADVFYVLELQNSEIETYNKRWLINEDFY